jgi:hypothetical protein
MPRAAGADANPGSLRPRLDFGVTRSQSGLRGGLARRPGGVPPLTVGLANLSDSRKK